MSFWAGAAVVRARRMARVFMTGERLTSIGGIELRFVMANYQG
jgi:hypothetical protein